MWRQSPFEILREDGYGTVRALCDEHYVLVMKHRVILKEETVQSSQSNADASI